MLFRIIALLVKRSGKRIKIDNIKSTIGNEIDTVPITSSRDVYKAY